MSYIFLYKNILTIIIFVIFCTIVYPSNCYIPSSNGFVISTKNIYRYSFKTNTPLYSKTKDSSFGDNENILNYSDYQGEDSNSGSLNNPESGDFDSTENEGPNQDSLSNPSVKIDGTNFDEFKFDPERYKKILDSFDLFKGPSYSLSEFNKPLPYGCRTIVDFLKFPRNYDFSTSADITAGVVSPGLQGDNYMYEVNQPKEQRMEGPYLESGYDTIGKISQTLDRRFTTREEDEEPVEPEKMYDILKQKDQKEISEIKKDVKGTYNPLEGFEDLDQEGVKKDEIPLSKINPNYFTYDFYGYLQYYLKYINEYKYDIFSFHNKNDEKPSFYLNNDYIIKMERPFPPDRNHTQMVREYFLRLIPSLMDKLVDYIKNDPNKYNTPSPPMHDLSLLENFKLPEYLNDDYESDGEVDYEMYASLKGLHEPEKDLIYPYHNLEPLLNRQLLSTYLEIFNTNDLGPSATYKKYRSRSKHLKTSTFPTHTRPPKRESEFTLEDGGGDEVEEQSYNLEEETEKTEPKTFIEVREKLYEHGKKKRGKAMVYLEPGNGHIIINNRDGYQYVYYSEFRLREILEPLSSLQIFPKFNIVAKTTGGGISGQSMAIRHALVKYLYRILSPKLKPILRKFDLVSIDSRKVERKKTNLRKARKKEHYSKR